MKKIWIFAMASFALTTFSTFAADAPPAAEEPSCEQRAPREPAEAPVIQAGKEIRETRFH